MKAKTTGNNNTIFNELTFAKIQKSQETTRNKEQLKIYFLFQMHRWNENIDMKMMLDNVYINVILRAKRVLELQSYIFLQDVFQIMLTDD